MTDQNALRDALAAAIRTATCTGDCGQTEEECRQQRIQPVVEHHGRLAVVEGTPEQLADAVLPALPAPADRAATLRWAVERAEIVALRLRLKRDHGAATGAYEVVTELRRLADETQPAEAHATEPTEDARRLRAVERLCSGRPGYHTVTVKELLTAMGDAADRQDGATRTEVVHGCPPDGSGLTPCCGRTPFELPLGDRISSEAPTTCTGSETRQDGARP